MIKHKICLQSSGVAARTKSCRGSNTIIGALVATVTVTMALLLCNIPTVISTTSSSSRPPFCLSSIINDLEAEAHGHTSDAHDNDGCVGIATATLLCSRALRAERRVSLLKDIMTCGLSEEDAATTLEDATESDNSLTISSIGRVVNGVGVAVAAADTPSEAMSTLMACGGNTIIFLCSHTDLTRGASEGLFHTLAPAMEVTMKKQRQQRQLLLSSTSTTPEEEQPSTLIVVLPNDTSTTKIDLEEKFEKEIATLLPNLVQLTASPTATTTTVGLHDIFQNVVYLSKGEAPAEKILELLCSPSATLQRDPTVATSAVAAVAKATFTLDSLFLSSVVTTSSSPDISSSDLATIRTLLPIQRAAFETALAAVKTRAAAAVAADSTRTSEEPPQLINNYGQLCDAALKSALDSFDSSASSISTSTMASSSTVVRRLRNELQESLLSEYEVIYENQLKELKVAMFEKFRRDLSKIKVSANLINSLQEVMADAAKEFSSLLKKMQLSKSNISSSSWSSLGKAARDDFKKKMKEYCFDRLQAAKASGAFRPIPRKGLTIGLHWLLPKPFGGDNRFQPMTEREYRRNFVYHPNRAEVTPEEVLDESGAWRNKIAPNPAGSDMIY